MRVGEEEQRRVVADLLVLPRPAESLQNDAGFSRKSEKTGHAAKERMVSGPQSEEQS